MTTYRTYWHLLGDVHEFLKPRTYLEIGVHEGNSLTLAHAETRIVGVDPAPKLSRLNHPNWTVVPTTSEDFFREHDVAGLLREPLDLAFVDGLHLFEVALADLLSIEQLAHSETVVLIHDVLPISARTSTRQRTTAVWSGDVWKMVVLLRRHRPDLMVTTLDVGPTGMAIITGFDPTRTQDDTWIAPGIQAMKSASYEDLIAMGPAKALCVVAGTAANLKRLLPNGLGTGGHYGSNSNGDQIAGSHYL
ncbi:MAG TPA: class I SAM-dependent methyltransferase [Acidimicrobiaceae bacterium]|nr:class I SAM-dependent methyltransferase [Acidimicrobiaceae bacterium]|tara:strand:+ start:82 stop:825 length:744 start_codon:yes stop_codon:yes gene_type:complete